MDPRIIYCIGMQELKITVRGRWTLAFALVFGLLTLAISYFGLATAGYAGFQQFRRTTASLLNLVLYIVPLMSLTVGTQSLCTEPERQALLFAQPVSRREVLLGKLLGLFLSIAASTLIGFGLAGFFVAAFAGTDGFWRFFAFVLLSLVLALSFLSLAALASMLVGRQSSAFGLSIFLWFFFVVLYDLLVIGISFLLEPRLANPFTLAALFGNPVDMIRVAGLILLGGRDLFGAAGALLVRSLGGTGGIIMVCTVTGLLWILLPLAAAERLLRRQDI